MLRNAIIYAFYSSSFILAVHSFSVERKHLTGIWKLKLENPSVLGTKSAKDILLKIQEDGSFLQCEDDDGGKNGNWLHGCWEFQDSELKLAVDRQCSSSSSNSRDILLSGNLISEETLAVKQGKVNTGKFMYPQDVKFWRDFDNVMAASESCGSFSLQQTMGFYRMMMPASEALEQEKKKNIPKFQPSLFFDRKFFMTIVPIESKASNKPKQEWDNQRKEWHSPLDDQAADIRTMPIQFFANHTFEALGTNKVLRGRFEITENDKLWFRVSRFGMGRSTPGSVYSEGIGLSHEDERSYVGAIQVEEHKKGTGNEDMEAALKVEGKVTFGADLGSDARPEPVGTFIMTEVDDTSLDMKDEDEDDDEMDRGAGADDIFNSVFE